MISASLYTVSIRRQGEGHPTRTPHDTEDSARAAWLDVVGAPDLVYAKVERLGTEPLWERTLCEAATRPRVYLDKTTAHRRGLTDLAAALTVSAPFGYSAKVEAIGDLGAGVWRVRFDGAPAGAESLHGSTTSPAEVRRRWALYVQPVGVEELGVAYVAAWGRPPPVSAVLEIGDASARGAEDTAAAVAMACRLAGIPWAIVETYPEQPLEDVAIRLETLIEHASGERADALGWLLAVVRERMRSEAAA